ncbi:MAG: hypothetical protein HRU15_03020 [Planctomycetes bacterium]|nr:hypothetical protein [Planctomycetota bacterium]
MAIEDHNLEEFEPIKRGFNKKAFYWRLLWFHFAMAVVYAFIAGWPLGEDESGWWQVLYGVTASALLHLLRLLSGGAIKGLLLVCGYYIIYFIVFLLLKNIAEISYIYGILGFLVHVPIGSVVGWTLAQDDM